MKLKHRLAASPLVAKMVAAVARCLMLTWRWEGQTPDLCPEQGRPLILVCWHQELFMGLCWLADRGIYALASPHRDGALLQRAAQRLGWRFITGSSNRQPRQAYTHMLKCLREGHTLCLTPDGPRGPAHQAKPGCVRAAIRTGSDVIAITLTANRYWQLPTWDAMIIPKPWCTIAVSQSTRLHWDKNTADDDALKALLTAWEGQPLA